MPQIRQNIVYYRENAQIIGGALKEMGIWFTGGVNSPYIWMKCPYGLSSWEFFDRLLRECRISGTPGAGFGANGEGFFRLTAFGSRDATLEAAERLKALS